VKTASIMRLHAALNFDCLAMLLDGFSKDHAWKNRSAAF
jgi:hypothetical protein